MKTIFVSSTFKDMHFERDAIQEITLPTLKSEAIKYGENVSFCDLRWGINTGDYFVVNHGLKDSHLWKYCAEKKMHPFWFKVIPIKD